MTKKEERLQKQQKKLQEELIRLDGMKHYERMYQSYGILCGIDEVGRGALAGPVVASAVILSEDIEILYLNDSKKLTQRRRELLYDEIMEKALAVGVGVISHQRIDEINILQATYEAMQEAVAKLAIVPDVLLNDAVTIPKLTQKQVPIVKGDAKSISIAAASIIAKVTRDRMMEAYDSKYPGYHFASNKGYGSKVHIEAIKELGPCEIHRRTFLRNILEEKTDDDK